MKNRTILLLLVLTTISCTVSTPGQQPTTSFTQTAIVNPTSTNVALTETFTPVPPTETILPTLTFTPLATETTTPTPWPTVESLEAKVMAQLLSCRYGPGAEYLYLYALRAGANIKLIGRTDANDWVWVDGTNKCWVKSTFLEIAGDRMSLPVVYPGIAKLPITPYYPPSSWANATRTGNSVEITWEPVPISPGKYEDENMHQYIVEVWRCEDGQIIFETLGTNFPFITVENDETGCSLSSHGNVWVQEKHGFAGPTEIPWPPHPIQ
jgi:hypothetical protein